MEQSSLMGLNQIALGDEDNQTLVIQYHNKSDLTEIRAIARKCGMSVSAHVFVGNFIEVDVIVDLNYEPWRRPEKTWLRIAYECLDGNPNPCPNSTRFKGAFVYRYEHGAQIPVQSLLGGQGK
jgi:hypothetical protein